MFMVVRKSWKRFVSILLAAVLVLTSFQPMMAQNSQVSDLNGHWAETTIQRWLDQGLVNGYPDGSFRPDHPITRAETIALINRSFGLEAAGQGSVPFRDVNADAWYSRDVAIAVRHGYIIGYPDQTFRPDHPVTWQELAVIIARLLGLPESDSYRAEGSPEWSKGSIGAVLDANIMHVPGRSFTPAKTATRAEVVVSLDQALAFLKKHAATVTYDKPGTYGPEAGNQTIDGSVIVNAPGITLQNVTITGDLLLAEGIGDGDAILRNVTVLGTTTVKGGGANSVHFEDSILVSLYVNKQDHQIRIVVEGATTVKEVVLQSGAAIEAELAGSEGGIDLVRLSGALPKGTTVQLIGSFKSVEIAAEQIQLSIPRGSVEQLVASEGAHNVQIDLGDEAAIVDLIVDAIVSVLGSGVIENVAIHVSGAIIEPKPNNVTLKEGVTAQVGGETVSDSTTASPAGPSSGDYSPPSNAKSIVSTKIGRLESGNLVDVPAGTTVSELKRALTVSALASAEILSSPGGAPVTNQDTTFVDSSMVVRVTAENGTFAEYTITVDPVRVKIESGTYVGVRDEATNTISWKGIQYAVAPRFQPAYPLPASDEVIMANQHGKNSNGPASGDPDVLNLAIYSNPAYTGPKHVYVFINGSAMFGLSTNSSDWTQFVAANPDILVVAINHRGGRFGSLDLSQLEGYDDYTDENGHNPYQYSNNIARLDALEALRWINRNIAAFGGDPNDVTVGGQSSGANIWMTLLMMEEAQPYFHKALLQESFPVDVSLMPLDEARIVARDLFRTLKVTTMEEFLALPNDVIARTQIENPTRTEYKGLAPVIDDVVIPSNYFELLMQGIAKGKTIMMGSNEGTYDQMYNPNDPAEALNQARKRNWGKLTEDGWNDKHEDIIAEFLSHNELYGRDDFTAAKDLDNDLQMRVPAILLAEALSMHSNVYLYYLTWDINPTDGHIRTGHGSENAVIQRRWNAVFGWNDSNRDEMIEHGERLSNLFAQFIRSGNPNFDGLGTTWTPYNSITRDTLVFSKTPQVVHGVRNKDTDLLLPLLREYPLLAEAKKDLEDPDVRVTIESGTYVGVRDEATNTISWKGIRYAVSPRFQRAHPLPASDQIFLADRHGRSSAGAASGDEDILSLAIYANPAYTGPKHVYVYIDGNANVGLSTSSSDWTKFVAANPDILVVAINHRGGRFGSLDLSQLEGYDNYKDENGQNPYRFSNNLARLDALEALKWINRNIAAFGGDPDDVTVGGQSSGANVWMTVLMMPEAQPYFHKALLQESFPVDVSLMPLDEAKIVAKDLFDTLKVTTMEEFLALPNNVIASTQIANPTRTEYKALAPVVDDVTIPSNYLELLMGGIAKGKKIMMGSNEGTYDQMYRDPSDPAAALNQARMRNWGKLTENGWNDQHEEIVAKFLLHNELYDRDDFTAAKDLDNDLQMRVPAILLANALTVHADVYETDVYLYYLTWDINPNDGHIRAGHGSENRVIQRRWDEISAWNDSNRDEMLVHAERLSNLWAQFIRTGNPNFGGLGTTWTKYNSNTRDTLVFSRSPHVVQGVRNEDTDLLLPLLREYQTYINYKNRQ